MLFAIADLHLSGSVDKPMDIFGRHWQGYEQRLRQNWQAAVGDNDTVVIPGDVSWGMTMRESIADFLFLDSLPGRKLIGKGNHDYWWTSLSKMTEALETAGVTSVAFLHNRAFEADGYALCGSKGYMWDSDESDEQNAKLTNRELSRLEISLRDGQKTGLEPLVFLHYPPVTAGQKNDDFVDLMLAFGVKRCFYGHIHGPGHRAAFIGDYRGIDFSLISADYLEFNPLFIK